MTDIKKPEALRLAECLDNRTMKMLQDRAAASELRRLHAEIEATNRQVEILTDELSKCDKENAELRAALRQHIRTYRVDDQHWAPEEEANRLMALVLAQGEKE